MNLAGHSVSGPRPYNEDCYYYKDFARVDFPHGISAFVLVSDGMGGHQGGDIASKIACQAAKSYVEVLIEMAQSNPIELNVADALRELVANANQAIIDEMHRLGSQSMGATFVGAFLSPAYAWIAHVGDSRAYRVHRGIAQQLTRDHSVVGKMLADGLISEEQAQVHPKRNVIERALGFNGEDAEITEVSLGRGDALLLCSDGVSTVLDSHILADVLSQAASIEAGVEALTAEALAAKTDDNATVVVATANWRIFKAQAPKKSWLQRILGRTRQRTGKKLFGQKSILVVGVVLVVAILAGIWAAQSGSGGGGVVPSGSEPSSQTTTNTGSTAVKETSQQASLFKGEPVKWKLGSSSVELKFLTDDNEADNFKPKIKLDKSEVLLSAEPSSFSIKGNKEKREYYLLDPSYLRSVQNSGSNQGTSSHMNVILDTDNLAKLNDYLQIHPELRYLILSKKDVKTQVKASQH